MLHATLNDICGTDAIKTLPNKGASHDRRKRRPVSLIVGQHKIMNDKYFDQLQSGDTKILICGVLSLATGVLFCIPGVFFSFHLLCDFFYKNFSIDPIKLFISVFTLSIGIFLLLLSIKCFRGQTKDQYIATPVYIIIGIFFIGFSVTFFMLTFVVRVMEPSRESLLAIGCGLFFGTLSLRAIYKKKKQIAQQLN